MMKNVPVLLIGGTGRSGTNVLKYVLSTHSQIYSLPFESRFTIDPDGILPTYALLKDGWSPFVSEVAIKRMDNFLKRLSKRSIQDRISIYFANAVKNFGLTGNIRAYKEWELEKAFPNFKKHTSKLIKDLELLEYKGVWAGRKGSLTAVASNVVYRSNKNNVLSHIINEYFYNLYNDLLLNNGKALYVEDNTFNILSAHHYSKLLPGSFMVHMVRDPRDVVASYIKQRWCPKDIEQASKYYIEIIERWLEIRRTLDSDFFTEIRLEDLCNNTEAVLRSLCNKLTIDFEDKMLEYNLNQSNTGRWKTEFSYTEKQKLNKYLDKYIKHYKYQP
ncbi:MAG: sulfotransferase family protein [Campylobacterales bacterium]